MQAWGDQQSKFAVRRSAEAPTKSGVTGMLCAALGVGRREAEAWFPKLNTLRMGVRVDLPGIRSWDWHTVGGRLRMRIAEAEGKSKPGALLTRREYLCDASFLVALQGDPELIAQLAAALENPKWTLYLGRKCCPPSRPVFSRGQCPPAEFSDLLSALSSIPWQPRQKWDKPPESVDCFLEWRSSAQEPEAPADALIWYDVPMTFEPPSHEARFVVRTQLRVGADGTVAIAEHSAQNPTPRPLRPRADYKNSEYQRVRGERLQHDSHLCVFCKAPAGTVQHVTYRHGAGNEKLDTLRSLCRLCHDAVTMIEYGLGMGLDRINPEDPQWRDRIIEKRAEIIKFRSRATRARRLAPEEVE